MTLKFTDSPPPGRAKFDLAPILAELKANPGKWAMVEKIKSTNQATKWRAHGCEATIRKNGDGWDCWVRWPA